MGKPDFNDTSEIEIPSDPFERIIGQEQAVNIAKLIPIQRRHLLLVGAPGTGKSMIAQAIASVLPKPTYEISVMNNSERPERPIVEIRDEKRIKSEQSKNQIIGSPVPPLSVPTFVAERLGFRCRRCGALSSCSDAVCPACNATKFTRGMATEKYGTMENASEERARVATTRRTPDGRQETVVYERTADNTINVLTQLEVQKITEENKKTQRKVIVPLSRALFVQASGASETEILGDVRHDPYGSHPQLGTPPYIRVIPGAIHEAHEGVLFIDELSALGNIQRYLLTAMQEKLFPIIGRNPTSSGASVRVDAVPCDFLFVGATNINDISHIVPALRSRIRGDGYEILMNSSMPYNNENTKKIIQFIAQEIKKDGKIPHASAKAVDELLSEARNIAKRIDNFNGYTLRLRNISGIIKMAGDFAILNKHELIEKEDVFSAVKSALSIEEQLADRYESTWMVSSADYGMKQAKPGPETA